MNVLRTRWLVVGLALAMGCGKSSSSGPIKIGAVFNLTGSQSVLDVPSSKASTLAVNEINAAGGVLGRPLELDVMDGATDPATAAAAARTLATKNQVVAMVGLNDSDTARAAAQAAQAAQLPFLIDGATDPTLPQTVGNLCFLACFGDNVQAAAAAQYAFAHFGQSVYLMWDKDTSYTQGLHQYFTATWGHLGGTVIADAPFADTATDFSANIAAIKALPTPPPFIYAALQPQTVGPLVSQFRAAGLNMPILGGDGYDDPTWVASVGGASENVYFTTHALVDPQASDARTLKLVAAYSAANNGETPTAFAILGYDAIYLLADAIKRANATDAASLKTALESTSNFSGVTGSISFTPTSHVPAKAVWVIRIQGGKYTKADEFVPTYIPAPPR